MLTSGFTNAPVSKFLVFGIVVTSVTASISDLKHYFFIEVVPHLWGYGQFWRLFTYQLCYTNSTEVLFAVMTFYQLRVVERLWGSRKFASFILSTLPFTALLPTLLLTFVIRPLLLNHPSANYLPAGPTPLLFALLAQYHAAIPHIYKYRLSSTSQPSSSPATGPALDLSLTSKTTSYLLPLQLALSQLPGSLVSALAGWLVGAAWRAEALPGARWRIPDALWRAGPHKSPEAAARQRNVEGLRRRIQGETAEAQAAQATASGVSPETEGTEAAARAGAEGRRRSLAGQFWDQFRVGM